VNVSQLFVLAILDRKGPMHGHQIRREAQIDQTERWTEIKVGSLYAALHRLADDGLIEAVRTEQEGNLPTRTVYGITPEGSRELRVIRERALRHVRVVPDPFDLAFQYSADIDEEQLRAILEDRRHELVGDLQTSRHLCEAAQPYVNDIERMIMRHRMMRLETEISWHEEVLDQLTKLLDDARDEGNDHNSRN
jgi:DNA-binding PadR family transcriptional regulator